MSASEDDPTFARVWVKDEPDDNIEEENVDGIATDDDDDIGQKDEESAHVDIEIDPMSFVKSEAPNSDSEEAPSDDEDWDRKPRTKHTKVKATTKYTCPHCPYKAKLSVLRSHVRKHNKGGLKKFKCPFCPFSTNYDTALRRHLRTQHCDDSEKKKKVYVKKYSCTLCNYVTAHRHGLVSHMHGKHRDDKPHQCAFCEYRTKYSTALHRHRLTQHKDEVRKLGEAYTEYKCTSCDFIAFLKCELRQHEKKHMLKFKCRQCGHKTDTDAELQMHLLQHDSPEGFLKQFKLKVKTETPSVSQVLGSNTDPIFKCKICEHESITYVAFLEHVKTHEKPNTYKCNVCAFETECNKSFLEHLQVAHGVTEDGMNDIKVISEGIMNAMQAISNSTPNAPIDSDDEPLASFADDRFSPEPAPKRKRPLNKIFSCEVCPYTSKYKVALKSHMGRHVDGKPYQCPLCEYCTKYPNSMRRHKLLKHPESYPSKNKPKEYVCHMCSYRTFFKNNLNQHLRKHNPDKQFKCELCSFTTAYRTAYLRHGKVHKRKADGQTVTHQCDMCPYTTQFEGRFHWHMLKTHNKRSSKEKGVKCEFCDFETSRRLRFRLTAHLLRSKQESVTKCLHCDFETIYKCQIKYHRKTHYPPVNLNYVTKTEVGTAQVQSEAPENLSRPEAPQSFFGQYKDDSYEVESAVTWKKIPVLEDRSRNKPFSCYKCPYASRFKSSVQRHYQRIHGDKSNPYRCSHCDFGTSTKDSIALHTKRSKQNMPMSCDCGQFTTYYKCEFVAHQKLHNPYRCSKCTYSSKSRYDLERHYTMHSNKGYKCQYCDYVAVRRDTLMTHEVTHTGVKPYQCHLCGYGSMRLTFLEKHILEKHEGDASRTQPYQCHACPFGSYSQAKLDRHITQNHMETSVTTAEEPAERQEENESNDRDSGDNAEEPPTLNPSYYDDSSRTHVEPSVENQPAQVAPDIRYPTTSDKVTEKGVKPFQCPVCPYSAFSPKVLKKHMTIHSEVPIVNLNESVDTAAKPFQCHLCPYSSFRPNILKNHLILKHSITPPSTFVEEYNTPSAEKTYQCHLCPYSSMSINVLNKHLARKHETRGAIATEQTVKTFQCHHCPFNSLNPNVLKKHVIQTHSGLDNSAIEGGSKPFRCQICPYNTFSPKVLRKHLMQRHPGVSRSNYESFSDNSVEVVSVASEND